MLFVYVNINNEVNISKFQQVDRDDASRAQILLVTCYWKRHHISGQTNLVSILCFWPCEC